MSAGPAGSPQWPGGRPAASLVAPCRSGGGSQPGTTDQPEPGTDLIAESRSPTALTTAWRWRQSESKPKEELTETAHLVDDL